MRTHLLLGVFTLAVIVVALTTTTAVATDCKPGTIVEPRWAAPFAVKPGTSFTIELAIPASSVERVYITNGTIEYSLAYRVVGDNSVEATVPPDTAPGLYDLIVVVEGKECGEHNALWVLDEYPETMVLMHVSDTHFGVFNPTGRVAEEYNLAAVILALSMPNVTAIVATGDIADTAEVEQYQNLRLVYWLLDKPVFIAPGNHDHVGGSDNFEAYVAPLRWARTIGDFLIMALDSGYDGYISVEQAKWAAKTILETTATAKIILVHHPLFAYVYGDTPHSFNVASPEELLEVLKTKKPDSRYPYIYTSWLENEEALKILVDAIYNGRVTAVLSGHIHVDSYAEVHRENGGTTYFIVATTLGGPIRLERNDYHGFRIVVVDRDGSVKVLGQDVPWARHSSFNIEGVQAVLKTGPGVASVVFRIDDPRIAGMLPYLRLAVPVPKDLADSDYKIYAPGFEKVWKKCTPLYCAVYAETASIETGKWYVLAVYTVEDKEPPRIVDAKVPDTVPANKPIEISYTVSDDAWGVSKTLLEIEIDGQKIVAAPAVFGNTYKLSLPPLGKPATIKVKIIVYDASGKETVEEYTIKVVQPEKPTKTPTPTPTPTQTTPTPTRTMTPTQPTMPPMTMPKVEIEPVEITVTVPEVPEVKEITVPSAPAPPDPTIAVVAGIVGLVLAALVYIILAKRS